MKPEKCPPESLEARLRALPQPKAPARLKARLMVGIPKARPVQRRSPISWITVVCSLAVVASFVVLAVLTWDRREPTPAPVTSRTVVPVSPRPIDDTADGAQWLEARRVLNGAELSPFAWPLEETSPVRASTSIPADLLD
jgi:hypothetical protein